MSKTKSSTPGHSPTKTVRRVLSTKRPTLPVALSSDSPSVPPSSLSLRNRGGRPAYYQSPEEMQDKIDEYIRECESGKRVRTWTGLVFHLGFSARDAMDEYAARDERYSDTVKAARLLVEMGYEERLHVKDCIGAIFALKNMGWTDRQDINVRGVIAGIDLDKFSDEQLQRVRAGAHPLQVMQEVRLLPPPA